MYRIVDSKVGVREEHDFDEDEVSFTLPVKKGAVITKTEIKRKIAFRGKNCDVLAITATSTDDESIANRKVATITIFRFASAELLTAEDYEYLRDLKTEEITSKGFVLGNNTQWNQGQRWFYLERRIMDRLLNKIYSAVLGQFIIMIDVYAWLPVERIVDSFKIITKTGDLTCIPLEEGFGQSTMVVLADGKVREATNEEKRGLKGLLKEIGL